MRLKDEQENFTALSPIRAFRSCDGMRNWRPYPAHSWRRELGGTAHVRAWGGCRCWACRLLCHNVATTCSGILVFGRVGKTLEFFRIIIILILTSYQVWWTEGRETAPAFKHSQNMRVKQDSPEKTKTHYQPTYSSTYSSRRVDVYTSTLLHRALARHYLHGSCSRRFANLAPGTPASSAISTDGRGGRLAMTAVKLANLTNLVACVERGWMAGQTCSLRKMNVILAAAHHLLPFLVVFVTPPPMTNDVPKAS